MQRIAVRGVLPSAAHPQLCDVTDVMSLTEVTQCVAHDPVVYQGVQHRSVVP
jgi:hypothetical protein